ncbi:hypothetical protein ACJRO7_004427 [Eucalyptus globulus]|uniref:Uncharacterized protein n=1 Tax=Eucalyptus globulus TaxID=34317 RepID=A0ABD3IWJ6_EUCGL
MSRAATSQESFTTWNKKSQHGKQGQNLPHPDKWRPPPPGVLTINIDASFEDAYSNTNSPNVFQEDDLRNSEDISVSTLASSSISNIYSDNPTESPSSPPSSTTRMAQRNTDIPPRAKERNLEWARCLPGLHREASRESLNQHVTPGNCRKQVHRKYPLSGGPNIACLVPPTQPFHSLIYANAENRAQLQSWRPNQIDSTSHGGGQTENETAPAFLVGQIRASQRVWGSPYTNNSDDGEESDTPDSPSLAQIWTRARPPERNNRGAERDRGKLTLTRSIIEEAHIESTISALELRSNKSQSPVQQQESRRTEDVHFASCCRSEERMGALTYLCASITEEESIPSPDPDRNERLANRGLAPAPQPTTPIQTTAGFSES